jgi:hypothetical protein
VADRSTSATTADVLRAAADHLEATHPATRITAPIMAAAVRWAARELAADCMQESQLGQAAVDALYTRLPAGWLDSWSRTLPTAEVLTVVREASRAEQIIHAKQQLLANPACPRPAFAGPADVYADAEYARERSA